MRERGGKRGDSPLQLAPYCSRHMQKYDIYNVFNRLPMVLADDKFDFSLSPK